MRHAYAIIAFNNWSLLEKLIMLLDDERNDLYIHVNINVKDCDFDHIKSIPKKSNIYFLNRLNTEWGTDGLAKVQLEFYKAAHDKHYQYYHNISGVCLPLKSQNEIHDFFNNNSGKEFVHFVSPPPIPDRIYTRYSYYHYFKKYIRYSNKIKSFGLGVMLEGLCVNIQKIIGIDRQKNLRNKLCYGSNWSSITDNLVDYVLSHEKEIYSSIANTFAPDECFLQTLVYNSEFKENLYYTGFDDNYISNLRYIDWKRGNPYTLKNDDFDELVNSDYLFARKFDEKTDKQIIDRIYDYVQSRTK